MANPDYKSKHTGQQVDNAVDKANKSLTTDDLLSSTGYSTTKTMSQSAITNALNDRASVTDINNAIENHNTSQTAHQDIRNLVELKPNASNIYNDSTANTYSSNYMNNNFAPLVYVNNLYANKTGTNTADLLPDIPEPNANNILSSTTTNTDYDWTTPEFTFTRQLAVNTTLTENNSFELNLKFRIDRNATLSFATRVKVSTDNGVNWTYISSQNWTTSSNEWSTGVGNTIDMVVYTDLLAEPTTYQVGTLFAIEVYKKQVHTNSLTTTVYCGVLVDGANIYTYIKFNFTNVNINTNQIRDGAVTYNKLDSNLQGKIDEIIEVTTPKVNKGFLRYDSANNQYETILPDSEVSNSSDNMVSSRGVYTYLQGGIPYLTTAPTADNTNGRIILVVLPESQKASTIQYVGYWYVFVQYPPTS